MRKSARALALVFLAFVTSALLSIGSAFVAVLAFGATALIVPGTGTPNANDVDKYLAHAADRYIAPFEPCSTTNDCDLQGINYPASFWPLGFIPNWCPGYQCDTWNESVGTGVENLDTALRAELAKPCPDTGCEPIILFGYSQGGAVVSNELRNLGDLTPEELSRLSVVVIGNAFNPDGGIFTRLGFLPTIPILDVTFGPPMPTDTGIPITSVGFEYDPVMYAPLYWGNGLTMLNALAAFETVHGYYLTPDGNGPTDPIAYGYDEKELAAILAGPCPGANCRVDSNGNKYYMIPAKSLPIVDLLTSLLPAPLQPLFKPVADLISPVLKVVIDLGYDWSGDPGVERWLSPLPFNPFQNWGTVGKDLVAAVGQGLAAFLDDLGVGKTIAPTAPAPTTVSTLASKSTDPATPGDTTSIATNTPTAKGLLPDLKALRTLTTTLTDGAVQKDDETVVAKTDADAVDTTGTSTTQTTATETKPSKTDDPPVTKLDNTTKPDDTTKPVKKRQETKKDWSNRSLSLNFSPKKTTKRQSTEAGSGQPDATSTTASSTSTDTADAAA